MARADAPGSAAARADRQYFARPAHAIDLAARLPRDAVAQGRDARRNGAQTLSGDCACTERQGRAARAGAIRTRPARTRQRATRARAVLAGPSWPGRVPEIRVAGPVAAPPLARRLSPSSADGLRRPGNDRARA